MINKVNNARENMKHSIIRLISTDVGYRTKRMKQLNKTKRMKQINKTKIMKQINKTKRMKQINKTKG